MRMISELLLMTSLMQSATWSGWTRTIQKSRLPYKDKLGRRVRLKVEALTVKRLELMDPQ